MTRSILKARRYVSSPVEVPEGLHATEGKRGGWYYETGTGQSADKHATDRAAVLSQFSEIYVDSLTRGQKVSIEKYAGGDAWPWNQAVRKGETKGYRAWMEDIDGAMRPLAQPMQLYRGVNGGFLRQLANGSEDLDDLVGVTFQDKGYTSTTFDEGIADLFTRGQIDAMLMRVNVRKGAAALFVDPVMGQDFVESEGGESEMLLGRGGVYQVTGIDRSGKVPVLEVSLVKSGKMVRR